jgi:hypothetical protein
MDSTIYFFPFVYAWLGLAVLVFFINLFIKAPYGRHSLTTWGPMIANRTAWILMELPALLTCPLLFFSAPGPKGVTAWILISLWTLHYTHRTLIFPFRIRTRGKRMPAIIMMMGMCFNLVNGFICGYYLGYLGGGAEWPPTPWFWVGVTVFCAGMALNLWADTRLINLRKPGETGYKIPEGGAFRYVSCPNITGEIIEWVGFALAAMALPVATFAIWTVANLIPRSLAHHRWYQERFPNYPKDRKAFLPFLW